MSDVIIKKGDDIPFEKSDRHIDLMQKMYVTPEEADIVGIKAHAVVFEKLGFRGAVKPHTHKCVEIICLIKGNILLYNGMSWKEYSAGDVFIVGAGQIHSVINLDPGVDSEQISFFIPIDKSGEENTYFDAEPAEVSDFEKMRNM